MIARAGPSLRRAGLPDAIRPLAHGPERWDGRPTAKASRDRRVDSWKIRDDTTNVLRLHVLVR